MSRFDSVFGRDRPALVTFVTGGDPSPAYTSEILDALVEGGADIVELGMPFTDPMADGPVIQAANLRSLAAGTSTADLFAIATAFRIRHPQIPLVLMGYANPMARRGGDWFATACCTAGVDGVICVDLPPEEDAELGPALRAADIDFIRLATPTTDTARLPTVVSGASGFIYYVAVAGITGMQQAATTDVAEAVTKLKAATSLPVVVGFGVRTAQQVAAIGCIADGVVVGSAIVEIIGEHGTQAAEPVRAYVASLASALKGHRL